MNMGSHDKNNQGPGRLIRSFGYALAGISNAVIKEKNIRIHLFFSLLAVFCSVYFSISKTEWLFVLLAIGGMFSLELMNTAVERTVDLVTREYHPLAKQAKDIAAGAVFVYALLSIIIGLIIFGPKAANLMGF